MEQEMEQVKSAAARERVRVGAAKHVPFATLLAAVLLAVALCLPSGASAVESDENAINTQQMPDSSFLYDTSIYDLANADASYDGKTVQVTGEVIGDAIWDASSEGKVWITLSSQDEMREGALSVLIDEGDLELIDTYGGYDSVGTTLQVKGEFHLACSVHEGAADIHAEVVKATAEGTQNVEQFNIDDFVVGLVMLGVGVVLTALYYLLRERQR